jgi:hypothetical protein
MGAREDHGHRAAARTFGARWPSGGLVPDREASADCGLDNRCALRKARARLVDSAALGSSTAATIKCRRNAFASEYLILLRFGLLLLCDPV